MCKIFNGHVKKLSVGSGFNVFYSGFLYSFVGIDGFVPDFDNAKDDS